LSDVSQGPGWWEASDGKWYPPKESEQPPAPGWWLAADGKWYPPAEAAAPPKPGWWLAADGEWYPPKNSADTASTPSPDPAPIPADQPTESKPTARSGSSKAHQSGNVPSHLTGMTAAERAPRTVAQAAEHAMPVRRRSLDAHDQIRTRNDASRQDAATQATARMLAAARALESIESERKLAPAPVAHPVAELAPAPATSPAPAPPPPPPAPPMHAAPNSPAEAHVPVHAQPPVPGTVAPTANPFVPASPERAAEPLIELRTSPLGAEVDHIGDRLLVFADRVELRDRLDRIRQHLDGPAITDVVVQRKFTGAVLVVEGVDGSSIMTRGLRPEQAEQAKVLIHKRTRQGRPPAPRKVDEPSRLPTPLAPPPSEAAEASSPAAARSGRPAAPEGVSDVTAERMALLNQGRLNEADLLRKLADLHRAGVLNAAEFEEKIALVGQLVAGETLVIT
jgi:hypothetical protein